MEQLMLGQYSVAPGEKAILQAVIKGNAFVKVSKPMAETSTNIFECTVDQKNIAIDILVQFPDTTPGSQVDLTIDGELAGKRGNGPFPIASITPISGIQDPTILLVVKH
jgi:hypothetical protein